MVMALWIFFHGNLDATNCNLGIVNDDLCSMKNQPIDVIISILLFFKPLEDTAEGFGRVFFALRAKKRFCYADLAHFQQFVAQ